MHLHDQLRIINTTQISFPSHLVSQNYSTLPSVSPQKQKNRIDRYSSQRVRYQNSLQNVLVEIKKEMEGGSRKDYKYIKFRSARKVSPIMMMKQRQDREMRDIRVRAVNLSPGRRERVDLTHSYFQSMGKKQRLGRRQMDVEVIKYTKFECEPWFEEEMEYPMMMDV